MAQRAAKGNEDAPCRFCGIGNFGRVFDRAFHQPGGEPRMADKWLARRFVAGQSAYGRIAARAAAGRHLGWVAPASGTARAGCYFLVVFLLAGGAGAAGQCMPSDCNCWHARVALGSLRWCRITSRNSALASVFLVWRSRLIPL